MWTSVSDNNCVARPFVENSIRLFVGGMLFLGRLARASNAVHVVCRRVGNVLIRNPCCAHIEFWTCAEKFHLFDLVFGI